MSRKLLFALLALLLVRALAIPVTPLLEPSEGRYAVVAKLMADEQDWVTPRLWHEGRKVAFLGKPPLHFWISAGLFSWLGQSTAMARVPSLIMAILLTAMLVAILSKPFGNQVALRAAVIMAACPFFFALSGAVLLDMTLAFCVDGALLGYFAYLTAETPRSRAWWSRAVFALLALGMLAKGPVCLVMLGLAVGAWSLVERRFAHLRGHAWLSGTALFLAITSPWYLLCERANPGFLRYFLLHENFLRYLQHDYGDRYGTGHEFPFGTALLFFLAGVLPWLAFAWKSGHRSPAQEIEPGGHDRLASRFFLIGAAAILVFFCFAHQLLWTYVLPAIPLAAAWLALRWKNWPNSDRTVSRVGIGAAALYLVLYMGSAPWLGQWRSPKAALAFTKTSLDAEANPAKEITFLRKTPYTATFLAGEKLWHHGEDTPEAELRAFLARPSAKRFLGRRRDQGLAESLGLQRLAKYGDWLVYQPGPES